MSQAARWLAWVVLAAAGCGGAWAQNPAAGYPGRPVRWVVPFPPGASNDIIVAHPSFPPKSAKELVDYARANPGKVNWGSSGTGSSLHIGLALFQAATGVNVVHVPYKGAAPALTDVVGGQINLMYTTTVSGEAHIKAGRVKVLGVADTKRTPALPEVPTLAEQGIQNETDRLMRLIKAGALEVE